MRKLRATAAFLFALLLFWGCQKEIEEKNTPPTVNLGKDTTITLTSPEEDSIRLSGIATDKEGSVVAYLWSEVSGPNIPVFSSAGSASTFIKGVVSGTYIFQLMATDDDGATGVKTITVTVTIPAKDVQGPNTPPTVILGKDTTFNITTITEDSIRLNGSATDKEGTVVAYLWSEVSGPSIVDFTNPGSSSTSVKGIVSGDYVFQLMATDNDGATGVKTIKVTVAAPQIVNLILQPHQNPNEVLLAVNYTGNASDRTAPELAAAAWTNAGSPALTRGIFKFDFSNIPANATIVSAKLTLYSDPTPLNGDMVNANYGDNNSMLLQKVTSAWSNNVTWQNQPSTDASKQITLPHTEKSFEDLKDIDVTNLVKDMLPNKNFGFLIKLQNERPFNSRVFCSSKYPDATKHPKLVIQYFK